jgi:hypothetical protein
MDNIFKEKGLPVLDFKRKIREKLLILRSGAY